MLRKSTTSKRESRKVVVAQLGARRGYAVPMALSSAGWSVCLATDLWLGRVGKGLGRIPLLPSMFRRAQGRNVADARFAVKSWPAMGVVYAAAMRLVRRGRGRRALYLAAGTSLGRLIPGRLLEEAEMVYGFNSASESLFERAKERNCRTVLDQTLVPHSLECRILQAEASRHREYLSRPEAADEHEGFARRESREWALADRIICGSPYVGRAISAMGVPEEKIRVVPSGLPRVPVIDTSWSGRLRGHDRPVRVLFVGEVGLRKGAPYLAEAMRCLPQAGFEARFVGPVALNERFRRSLPANAVLFGALPRDSMSTMYRWADVFCLPSLCEGSAMATYEALAHGLPVVTTLESGSTVRPGHDGTIVPAGEAGPLAGALREWGARAKDGSWCPDLAFIRESVSLEAYARRLTEALTSLTAEEAT